MKPERIKSLSWKTWVIIVIFASLMSAFGTAYVYSQNSSQTTTIEPASFTETASYIIFKVGNTIYAKNGTTGEIEFSGTDASQVIQSAINALTNGGKIYIKSGDYQINTKILITKRVTIEGEGEATRLFAGAENDIIEFNVGAEYPYFHVAMRDLMIDCVGTTNTGLIVNSTHRCIFENLVIRNGKIGLHLISSYNNQFVNLIIYRNRQSSTTPPEGGGILIEGHSNCNVFVGGRISNCVGDALVIKSGEGNQFLGVDFSDNYYGARLYTYAYRNLFLGCWFENNDYAAIRTYPTSIDNTFIGNTISAPTDSIGFFLDSAYNLIIKNTFLGQASNYLYLGSHSNKTNLVIANRGLAKDKIGSGGGTATFENNPNYITVNSGTATISAGSTSVTVNHGLAGTPTIVTVTPSADIGDVWVDSVTSTSFTIHCETAPSSDVTVYWYAEYKP